MTLPRFPAHELPAVRVPNQPNGGGFQKTQALVLRGVSSTLSDRLVGRGPVRRPPSVKRRQFIQQLAKPLHGTPVPSCRLLQPSQSDRRSSPELFQVCLQAPFETLPAVRPALPPAALSRRVVVVDKLT